MGYEIFNSSPTNLKTLRKTMYEAYVNERFPEVKRRFSEIASLSDSEPITPLTYSMMILACSATKDFTGAKDSWNLIFQRQEIPTLSNCTDVLKACESTDNLNTAFELFEDMKRIPGLKSLKLYNSILAICEKHTFWKRAILYTEEMESFDSHTLTILISLCRKTKYYYDAYYLFEELGEYQLRPLLRTYNCMISLFANLKSVEDATKYYQRILLSRMRPDVYSYSALLLACRESKDYHGAVKYFKMMKNSRVRPNAVTYNTIIGACVDSHKFTEAQNYYNMMRVDKIPITQYVASSMIRVYDSVNKVDRAKSMFREMLISGVQPNEFTYAALIHAVGRRGDVHLALRYFNEMKTLGVTTGLHTFNSLLYAASNSRSREHLKKFISLMTEDGLVFDSYSYGAVIALHCKQGSIEDAFEKYCEMEMKGIEPNVIVMGSILRGFYMSKNYVRVIELYKQRDTIRVPFDFGCFSTVIGACVRLGNHELARSCYLECLRLGLVSHWYRGASPGAPLNFNGFWAPVLCTAMDYLLDVEVPKHGLTVLHILPLNPPRLEIPLKRFLNRNYPYMYTFKKAGDSTISLYPISKPEPSILS